MGHDDSSSSDGAANARRNERRAPGQSASLPPLADAPAPTETLSGSALSSFDIEAALASPPSGSDAAEGDGANDAEADEDTDDEVEVPIRARDEGPHVVASDEAYDPNLPYRRTTTLKPVDAPKLGSPTPLELAVTQPNPAIVSDDDDSA